MDRNKRMKKHTRTERYINQILPTYQIEIELGFFPFFPSHITLKYTNAVLFYNFTM